EDDEGHGVRDEHRLADEEVVELDAQVDVFVEALLEGQLDVQADGEPASLTRAHIGRFHRARPASGDDGKAPAGERRRQGARGIIHRVGWTNARRAEEGYGRTERGQRIKARHELRLDPQHSPGVALEKLWRTLGPLQQLAVL